MSAYPQPTENLPIFDSGLFSTTSQISVDNLKGQFLQFPLAQSGLETVPNLQAINLNVGSQVTTGSASFQGTTTSSATISPADNSTIVATTSYVQTNLLNYLTSAIASATYATIASLSNYVQLNGTNAWTGTNSYNTNLPTSTIAPTTAYQFANKQYVDNSTAGAISLAGTNAWTGMNSYNTNLPTSTQTPTTAYQFANKQYVDNAVSGGAKSITTNYSSSQTITITTGGVCYITCIGSGGAAGSNGGGITIPIFTGGSGGGGGSFHVSLYLAAGTTISLTTGLNSNTIILFSSGPYSGTIIGTAYQGGKGGNGSTTTGGVPGISAAPSTINSQINGFIGYGNAGSTGVTYSSPAIPLYPSATGYNFQSYGDWGIGGNSLTNLGGSGYVAQKGGICIITQFII